MRQTTERMLFDDKDYSKFQAVGLLTKAALQLLPQREDLLSLIMSDAGSARRSEATVEFNVLRTYSYPDAVFSKPKPDAPTEKNNGES